MDQQLRAFARGKKSARQKLLDFHESLQSYLDWWFTRQQGAVAVGEPNGCVLIHG